MILHTVKSTYHCYPTILIPPSNPPERTRITSGWLRDRVVQLMQEHAEWGPQERMRTEQEFVISPARDLETCPVQRQGDGERRGTEAGAKQRLSCQMQDQGAGA